MKQTNQSIPYICIGAALLFAAFALTACAGSGGTKNTSQTAGTTTANGLVPACKSAIDDVTLYCASDKANTGKCNDAKGRTREYCIDQN